MKDFFIYMPCGGGWQVASEPLKRLKPQNFSFTSPLALAKFLASGSCSNYPKCRYTERLDQKSNSKD